MTSTGKSVALLGGPESGKTTYLGALTLGLESAKEQAQVRIADIGDDARGLRRLAEPLRRGAYPQRTKAERHTLDVALRTLGGRLPALDFMLRIADYDGEEIERLFDQRSVANMTEWQARAQADGLLLFVRPSAIKPLPTLHKPGTTISRADVSPSAPLFSPSHFSDGIAAEEVPPPRQRKAHEPVNVPTVLGLIELLQYLRELRGLSPGERPPVGDYRIGILLPSWDELAPEWQQKRPQDYLVEHAPVLLDYLWSNHHLDDVFYFGLSATGGDLNQPEHKQPYIRDPQGYVRFAKTNGGLAEADDLSLPILWALFGDRALPIG